MKTPSIETLKMVALLIAGLTALWGMFVMGWCALRGTYVDVPMLLVLSNVVTGIASSITTLLVGRTIAQLNQQPDVSNGATITTTTVTPKDQPAEIKTTIPAAESQPEKL